MFNKLIKFLHFVCPPIFSSCKSSKKTFSWRKTNVLSRWQFTRSYASFFSPGSGNAEKCMWRHKRPSIPASRLLSGLHHIRFNSFVYLPIILPQIYMKTFVLQVGRTIKVAWIRRACHPHSALLRDAKCTKI